MTPHGAPGAANRTLAAEEPSPWLGENPVGEIVFEPDGVLVAYNAAAARMFRVPDSVDLRGRNCRHLCMSSARFDDTIRALQYTGKLENWDGGFTRFDNTPLHVVVNLEGTFDANRKLVLVRAHMFNITEWRRSQEQTQSGQRAEALGRLAGGIAHDFNNVLTIITGHAERLSMALPAGSPLRKSAEAIQESAARAATLTRQLLAIGRRQVLQPKAVNVNSLLRALEGDFRRTFGRRVLVTFDETLALPEVRVDPDHIERALATLATHSVDTMPDGGLLRFSAALKHVGPDRPSEQAFVLPGAYVQIAITHTGKRLGDSDVRLFEPFFAADGHGASLGLAAVFGVVKQSGGYLWVDSTKGEGTTFTILFPVLQDAAADAAGRTAPAQLTVVVADDEAIIRRLVAQTLKDEGYVVLEASCGAEAAALFEAHSNRIDLLISDVVMAGGGQQLGDALLATVQDLKVLYISGFPEDRRGEANPRSRFMQKPFTIGQLRETVRSLVGATAGARS